MSVLTISGIEMPSPTDYQVGVMDLDGKTTRTADGTLKRDRLAVKRKIEVFYAFITPEELKTVLQAISPVFFPVVYIDPQDDGDDGIKTGTFYAGDRTVAAVSFADGQITHWKDLKFSLVEQ